MKINVASLFIHKCIYLFIILYDSNPLKMIFYRCLKVDDIFFFIKKRVLGVTEGKGSSLL